MHTPEDVVGVDTETFYSSAYSVSSMGLYEYTHHPDFECYLVTIVAKDYVYAGPPEGADWARIADRTWVSHNMGFDRAVLDRCAELGQIPKPNPPHWHCTANMCVYFSLPRALKNAAQVALGKTISKDIRDREIKGKRWSEFGEDLQKRVLAYATYDSEAAVALWNKFGHKWPETERVLSRMTYDMGDHGVHLDADGLDRDIQTVARVRFEAALRVPWVSGNADKSSEEGVLSRTALHKFCRDNGVEPPKSMAKDSEEFEEWLEEHESKFPWIEALAHYRRSNTLLSKLQKMRARMTPEGRMPYSLLYGGAHTLRWSGSSGFNMQNMNREPVFITGDWRLTTDRSAPMAVDMRSKIVAAPGCKLVVADYAQIEARVTPWLAGDHETLEYARRGMSVYEAHARRTMGWTGGELKSENKALYQLAKARCVAGGTLVLTDRGYVPIQSLQLSDRVWDGIEFVTHQGVINNGKRPTIALCGDHLTDDHLVFENNGAARPAREIRSNCRAATAYRETSCAPGGEIRELAGALGRALADLWAHSRTLLMRILRPRGGRRLDLSSQRDLDAVPEVRSCESGGNTSAQAMGETDR